MMRRPVHTLVLGLVIAWVSGCQWLPGPFRADRALSKQGASGPDAGAVSGESTTAPAEMTDVAVIETHRGRITFKFYPFDAPNTVRHFKKLAGERFYDGLRWHRVEPGVVIQGGDPKGDGTGGPGFVIADEFNPRPHLEGTVGLAHPVVPEDHAGSQFYICLAPQPAWDGKYTVFGQTVSGFDTLERIEKDDIIESIRIVKQEIPK